MTINTGIDQAKRAELARSITGFLADTYALYLKTQGFHWNVTGLHFQALHRTPRGLGFGNLAVGTVE